VEESPLKASTSDMTYILAQAIPQLSTVPALQDAR
jgi:hypothetical protein